VVLLYISETLTLKEVLNRKLRVFEINILRRIIMGVSHRDRRRNVDVRVELAVVRDVVN